MKLFYSDTTLFFRVPIPSISTSTLSPCSRFLGCPGVPVIIISPGSNVMTRLINSKIVGILCIRFDVEDS